MQPTTIPKIIHYCWFGKQPKPNDIERYIARWKSIMPDYRFIEWNEDNYSLETAISYVKEAYEHGKWAFVSDYVRLHALYIYGGIYLDTDVEVFRRFDDLLDQSAFFGFESKDYLTTAVMGVAADCPLMQQLMDEYAQRRFVRRDGSLDMETMNVVVTRLMTDRGLVLDGKEQRIGDMTVYPQSYFSANDFINIFEKFKSGAYGYHHCKASWYDPPRRAGVGNRVRRYLLGIARNTFGTEKVYRLRHGNSSKE